MMRILESIVAASLAICIGVSAGLFGAAAFYLVYHIVVVL